MPASSPAASAHGTAAPAQRLGPLHLLALGAILALLVHGLSAELGQPLPFDAQAVYFPMAERWRADGWAYLVDADSVRAAPLTWMWPALFHEDAAALERAHLALAVLTAALLFDLGRRLHSTVAGLAAAALFTLAPQLRSLLVPALSEPLFFALTAAWWWAMAVAAQRHGRVRLAFVLLAAAAGGLSILTRPVWLYPALAAAAFACVAAWWMKSPVWRALAACLALTLALPAAYLTKNVAAFGLPAIATGQGNALYLGNHPATGGFEPYRLGLGYDDGSIAGAGGGLTLAGNARLGEAARALIRERSWRQHERWALHKLRAALLQLPGESALPRARGTPREPLAMRAFLLVAAALGAALLLRRPFVLLLALGALAQVAQLVLVLHNGRYSTGALEPVLIVLAGAGIAAAVAASRERLGFVRAAPMRAALAVAAVALGLGAATAALVQLNRALPLPIARLDGVPTRVWFEVDGASIAEVRSALRNGPVVVIETSPARVGIPVRDLWMGAWAQLLWRIEIAVHTPRDGRCDALEASFEMNLRTPAWTPPERAPLPVSLKADGRLQAHVFGASYGASAAFPGSAGMLWLDFVCPAGTGLEFGRIQLHEQLRLWPRPA